MPHRSALGQAARWAGACPAESEVGRGCPGRGLILQPLGYGTGGRHREESALAAVEQRTSSVTVTNGQENAACKRDEEGRASAYVTREHAPETAR